MEAASEPRSGVPRAVENAGRTVETSISTRGSPFDPSLPGPRCSQVHPEPVSTSTPLLDSTCLASNSLMCSSWVGEWHPCVTSKSSSSRSCPSAPSPRHSPRWLSPRAAQAWPILRQPTQSPRAAEAPMGLNTPPLPPFSCSTPFTPPLNIAYLLPSFAFDFAFSLLLSREPRYGPKGHTKTSTMRTQPSLQHTKAKARRPQRGTRTSNSTQRRQRRTSNGVRTCSSRHGAHTGHT